MNIHPLLVHFPIALFLLYSLFEIARFQIVRRQPWWFYVKAVAVIAGSAASVPTIIAGAVAKESFGEFLGPAVNVHETFAISTAVLFGIIALFYLAGWIRRDSPSLLLKLQKLKILNWFVSKEKHITEGWLGFILALGGACLVMITGGLGGLLVYGPHNDPATELLYSIITHFIKP